MKRFHVMMVRGDTPINSDHYAHRNIQDDFMFDDRREADAYALQLADDGFGPYCVVEVLGVARARKMPAVMEVP